MKDINGRDLAERLALNKRHSPAAIEEFRRRLREEGEIIVYQDQAEWKARAFGKWEVTIRVRGPEYYPAFQYDITFRSSSGDLKSELTRVIDGEGQYLMYCFGKRDSDGIDCASGLDLDRFRYSYERGLFQPVRRTPNGDGTAFVAFDQNHLAKADPEMLLFSAHPFIPTQFRDREREERRAAEIAERTRCMVRKQPHQASLFDQEEEEDAS